MSEVVGALSHALDVTEGQPAGHAERSCLIGMRIADEIGLGAAQRSSLFYALLLKDAGCSTNAAQGRVALRHRRLRRQARPQADRSPAPERVLRPPGPRDRARPADREAAPPARARRPRVGRVARANRDALRARRRHRPLDRPGRGLGGGHPPPRRALGRPRLPRGSGGGGDLAARAHPVPGPDRRGVLGGGRTRIARSASRASAAGAGSTRHWWTRSSASPPATRCGRCSKHPDVRAVEPADRVLLADERAPRSHRRRLRPRGRRQVALHRQPLARRRHDRRGTGRRDGHRRHRAAHAPPRRPAARPGQARRSPTGSSTSRASSTTTSGAAIQTHPAMSVEILRGVPAFARHRLRRRRAPRATGRQRLSARHRAPRT